jgi:hypothetical protein
VLKSKIAFAQSCFDKGKVTDSMKREVTEKYEKETRRLVNYQKVNQYLLIILS